LSDIKNRFYVNEFLSPRMGETSEGFLICFDTPVARTGEMIYKDGEVPVKAKNGVVKIRRDESVVFNDETIASLTSKPITIDHPDDFVTPENWSELAHGIVQNVRRGEGEQDDLLIADLLITTEKAIELVKAGLREISLGYDADYEELEEGVGVQKNIILNHCALVDRGRAGNRCAIGDKLCNHCGDCKCKTKNKTEDEGMQMKINSRVRDAFKQIKDAVEAELSALPKDDEKKDEKKDEIVKDKKAKVGNFIKDAKKKSKDADEDNPDALPAEGEETANPAEEIKEKLMELAALIDQVVPEEAPPAAEGEAPVEGEEKPYSDEEEKPAEEKADENDPASEDPPAEGEAPAESEEETPSDPNEAILARLDKLEAVIAELVKSDEEVHAAMDSIMKGDEFPEDLEKKDDEKKDDEKVEDEFPEDLEKKKKDEEDGEKKETFDAAAWNDLSYRVGILAPEMNIAKPTKQFPQIAETIKREALKKAFTTDTDSVKPFIGTKNINNLTGDRLDAAFVGASELIAKLNNSRVQRNSAKSYDAGSEIANSVRAINDKNKAFWKR
jgi:hypothetical protein